MLDDPVEMVVVEVNDMNDSRHALERVTDVADNHLQDAPPERIVEIHHINAARNFKVCRVRDDELYVFRIPASHAVDVALAISIS